MLATSWIKISFDFINNEKRKWSALLWNSMMLMSFIFCRPQDRFFPCHSGKLLDSARIRPWNPACLLIRDLSGLKYFPRHQPRAQSPVSSRLCRKTWLSDSGGRLQCLEVGREASRRAPGSHLGASLAAQVKNPITQNSSSTTYQEIVTHCLACFVPPYVWGFKTYNLKINHPLK